MTSKNTFKIAALVATFLFIASFWGASVAKAQCPAGYSERTVPMLINGCNYEVKLCVYCASGPGGNDVMVEVNNITMQGPIGCQTWNPNQVINYVYSQVKTYSFIHNYLCLNPLLQLPPCPQTVSSDVIKIWRCWYAEVVEYFGSVFTVMNPCNFNEYCPDVFSWCLGPDGLPVSVPEPDDILKAPSCQNLTGENVQWPVIIGQRTDCWWYKTPCDEQ